jgi:hypothetical protein
VKKRKVQPASDRISLTEEEWRLLHKGVAGWKFGYAELTPAMARALGYKDLGAFEAHRARLAHKLSKHEELTRRVEAGGAADRAPVRERLVRVRRGVADHDQLHR